MDEIKTQTKYPLEKEETVKRELSVYFMGVAQDVKPGNPFIIPQRYIGVVAYTEEQAKTAAMSIWSKINPNTAILYATPCDHETIKNLLSAINYEGVTIINEPTVTVTPEQAKLLSKERFKQSLMLTADELLKEDADKIKLKEIIEKI